MPAPRILTGPTINYSANAKQSEKLDRGFVLREIALKLSVGLTTTVGNAIDATNVSADGLWGVVKNIVLKLNSNTNIRNFTGGDLKLLNYFYYNQGDFPQEANLLIAADSTVTVESTLIMPIWMVDSVQPIDTQLDATLLSNLELEIEWGDVADITSATGATISTDPTLQVGTLNTFGIKGPFNTQIVTRQTESNTGVNSKYQIQLATGNMYRSLLIGAQTSAGVDDPGKIDNIRLFSGGTDFVNVPADMWDIWSTSRERNVESVNDAGTADGRFLSDSRDLDAWFYLDLVTDGHLSETLNSIGMSELKLELDINTSIDSLVIVKQEIVPAPARANG